MPDAVNARSNPFATDRTELLLSYRPEWIGTTKEELLAKWQQLDQRATLTGRHGAGKSTLLAWFRQHLLQQGQQVLHLFLNRQSKSFSETDWQKIREAAGKFILLDGEEQLGWRARRRFYQLGQAAEGLLVTRHRPGHLPQLWDLQPDIAVLQRCIRRAAPDYYSDVEPHLPQWWQKHRGNIRDILLECYDFHRSR